MTKVATTRVVPFFGRDLGLAFSTWIGSDSAPLGIFGGSTGVIEPSGATATLSEAVTLTGALPTLVATGALVVGCAGVASLK